MPEVIRDEELMAGLCNAPDKEPSNLQPGNPGGAKACIVNSRRKLQAVIRRRGIPGADLWNGKIAA